MAKEIEFENRHFWNFKSHVTLTLTSDDPERHIVVNVSSTLTNTTIWFVAALSLIVDVRTDVCTDYGRTDGWTDIGMYKWMDIFTGFIRSSLSRWPKNEPKVHNSPGARTGPSLVDFAASLHAELHYRSAIACQRWQIIVYQIYLPNFVQISLHVPEIWAFWFPVRLHPPRWILKMAYKPKESCRHAYPWRQYTA